MHQTSYQAQSSYSTIYIYNAFYKKTPIHFKAINAMMYQSSTKKREGQGGWRVYVCMEQTLQVLCDDDST